MHAAAAAARRFPHSRNNNDENDDASHRQHSTHSARAVTVTALAVAACAALALPLTTLAPLRWGSTAVGELPAESGRPHGGVRGREAAKLQHASPVPCFDVWPQPWLRGLPVRAAVQDE